MPICDICGKQISQSEMNVVAAPMIVRATEGGYIPSKLPSITDFAAAFGVSRTDGWRHTVMRNSTVDWGLCDGCLSEVHRYAPRSNLNPRNSSDQQADKNGSKDFSKDETATVRTVSDCVICPKCRTTNSSKAMNCSHCHINLEWARIDLDPNGNQTSLEIRDSSVQAPASVSTAITSATKVSCSRLWKCPKCGIVLEKSSYNSVFHPREPLFANYQGTSTCRNCGSVYDWRDVYSGRYDPEEKVRTASRLSNPPRMISVVAYLLQSMSPPGEVEKYAKQILRAKYPSLELHRHYLIGRKNDCMTETEALVQYNDYVRTGDLPDLGEQFDCYTGRGPDGTKVVVLYFKP